MKFAKLIFTVLILATTSGAVMACPTCFGAKGDPVVESMGMAIMFLLVIIMGTVGGIAAFFVSVIKRTRRYEQQLQEGNAEWGDAPELLEDES
jgi:hypothetical protein